MTIFFNHFIIKIRYKLKNINFPISKQIQSDDKPQPSIQFGSALGEYLK